MVVVSLGPDASVLGLQEVVHALRGRAKPDLSWVTPAPMLPFSEGFVLLLEQDGAIREHSGGFHEVEPLQLTVQFLAHRLVVDW
jgi:hypothetical protein